MKARILITLFCLMTFLGGCERQQKIQPSGNTVKIGVIGPFSGSEHHLGEDGVKGIRTVLHLNPFLENGDSVELVIVDDKNEPELSVQALKKLAEEDNVSAILIFSTTASVLAVNARADEYGVPISVLLATHQDIAKNTSYVSQLCFDNIFQGMVAALYVMDELLVERVAVFKDPDSIYSTSLADEFTRKYESLGGQVTDIIEVYPGTEITQTILDVVRENGADLLYLPIPGNKLVEILKATEDMGWNPRKMGGDGLSATVRGLQKNELKYINGLLAIDLYTQQELLTSFGEQVIKAHKKLFNKLGGTYAAAGAEGMAVLQYAINRCGNEADRQCINTMLRRTNNFEGLMGMITIKPSGKVIRPLIVNTIQDDQMKFVVKVY